MHPNHHNVGNQGMSIIFNFTGEGRLTRLGGRDMLRTVANWRQYMNRDSNLSYYSWGVHELSNFEQNFGIKISHGIWGQFSLQCYSLVPKPMYFIFTPRAGALQGKAMRLSRKDPYFQGGTIFLEGVVVYYREGGGKLRGGVGL